MGAIGDVFFRALFEDNQLTIEGKRAGTKLGNAAGLTLGQRMGATLGKSLNQNLGRGVSNAANNIGKMVAAGTVVAVGGLVAATRAAIDFEDAFAGIRKTVDETDLKAAGLSFEDLSDSIRKMAREMPIAATELAGIGEAAGALGIRGQDIEKFTEIVAKLSVTTDLTSEQAATALGQLGTTLHLTGNDFLEFGDALVALGNAGASTESQIIDMASRFAAAGTSAGLSKEEVLALSSAVASMGIDVEAGGTALSQTFNNITTGIGTSSAEAKAFADTLGLSAAQFKTAWDRDALGTFEDFLQELNKLDQFEQANILDKVGITGARQLNAVKLMAQNVGFVNAQLAISQKATGALGEEAAKKFATTASQIKILKNNLTDVGITIGNAVLPTITRMIGQFSTFLNDPKTQVGIKQFAVDLGKAVEGAARWVSRLDFDAIANSLKLAAGFAKGLLSAFMSAPQWLQAAVVTGWGLNKLTGGVVGSILGDVTKTLITGFGQQFLARGASPANPMFVSDVTGGAAGGILAGGKWATVGKVIGGAFVVSAAAGIAQALHGPLDDFAKSLHESLIGDDNPLSDFGDAWNDWRQNADWPFGQKNAPDWAYLNGAPPPKAGTISPNWIDTLQGSFGLANMANASKDDQVVVTGVGAHLTAMQVQLHADLRDAIKTIKDSNDPQAVANALGVVLTSVLGGAGNAEQTKALIAELAAKRDAALARGDTATATLFSNAIARLEPVAKGRQWQADQIAEAKKIVDSNEDTADKVADLKRIEADLLAHNRTMAADIVSKLIDNVNAVNNLPAALKNALGGLLNQGNHPGKNEDDRNEGLPTSPKPPKKPVPFTRPARSGPQRAFGGAVNALSPTWVGEHGVPELFVPRASGSIVPAVDVPGMAQGNTTINVPITGLLKARDPFEVATQLRRLGSFGVLTPRREPV